MSSTVPNLPPIGNIQDPAVRSYLEALTQMLLVRNGQTRNVEERFVTANELSSGIVQAIKGEAAGQGSSTLAETFRNLINHVKA